MTLLAQYKSEQATFAENVTVEMAAVFGSLNFQAIDRSTYGFVEASVQVAERRYREASAMGEQLYLSMRQDAGVRAPFTPFRPELDTATLRKALTVLGPIAAKRLMSQGMRISLAAERVFTLTSGRVTKSTLQGLRDTITGSANQDPEAYGYVRVTGAGACDFCLTLAQNTYRSAYTAMFSAGNRKRNITPQPMGAEFHDHCRCQVAGFFPGQVDIDRTQLTTGWQAAAARGESFDDFVGQLNGWVSGK